MDLPVLFFNHHMTKVLTPDTLVPLKLFFNAKLIDDNEISTERTLLNFLFNGNRNLKNKMVPLSLATKMIDQIGLDGVPWGTGNFSNREWFAFNFREALEDHFKTTIDTSFFAKLFRLPEDILAVSPYATCVNGMMVFKDGYGYSVAKEYLYFNVVTKKYATEEEMRNDFDDEIISASSVITAISSWSACDLQRICDRLGFNCNCGYIFGFNSAVERLKKIFQWSVISGLERTAANDFDQAMSKRRFLLACGSGSNINVFVPVSFPETEVIAK